MAMNEWVRLFLRHQIGNFLPDDGKKSDAIKFLNFLFSRNCNNVKRIEKLSLLASLCWVVFCKLFLMCFLSNLGKLNPLAPELFFF